MPAESDKGEEGEKWEKEVPGCEAQIESKL